MTVQLPKYVQIKDKCLIAYFGHANEYIIQLMLVRPMIEAEFPEMEIHYCFREEAMYLVEDESRILSRSQYKKDKHLFGYVRELTCNSQEHPVHQLMEESAIPYRHIWEESRKDTGKCLLSSQGNFPTRPLNQKQIKQLRQDVEKSGFECDEDSVDVDWVVGVESEKMMIAASRGAKVSLVPTGIGTQLVKNLFPKTEILTSVV